jgi:hypothetical protein
MTALSAQQTLVQRAANGGCPPFVLDIPRHAAPSTNVVEGLKVAVRRACHERRLWAGIPKKSTDMLTIPQQVAFDMVGVIRGSNLNTT